MGGRQLEGTRSAVGWFGSEPKEPLALERGTAAPPFPPPPLPSHPAPSPLPHLTHAPSPPPLPHPPPPVLVLCAAHAGLAPGCPSWPCSEQPGPKRGRGSTGTLLRTHQHMDENVWTCVNVCVAVVLFVPGTAAPQNKPEPHRLSNLTSFPLDPLHSRKAAQKKSLCFFFNDL